MLQTAFSELQWLGWVLPWAPFILLAKADHPLTSYILLTSAHFSDPHCHHRSPSLLCHTWILHVKFLVQSLVHSEYSMKGRQKMFIVNWRKCDTSIWGNISWFKHFKDSPSPLGKKSNFLLRPTALASAQPPTSPNDTCPFAMAQQPQQLFSFLRPMKLLPCSPGPSSLPFFLLRVPCPLSPPA